MREDEVMGAKRNQYLIRKRELEAERGRIDKEIQLITEWIDNIDRMRAYEEGRPLEAPVQRVSRLVDDNRSSQVQINDMDRLPRGWLKGKIVEYVASVGQNRTEAFTGKDVAEWIRAQGHELKLPQYNRVFMELKAMAEKGEEVQRVGKGYVAKAQGLHSEESV